MIEFADDDIFAERPEPEGGWLPVTCNFSSHRWGLEAEEGVARLRCLDKCDLSRIDPSGPIPCCDDTYFLPEDVVTAAPIPVRVVFVDDSTPSTPDGPAEYGYWLEIHPLDGLPEIPSGAQWG